MKINDEGTSNAAHWYERAMKAESRLAEAEAYGKAQALLWFAMGTGIGGLIVVVLALVVL